MTLRTSLVILAIISLLTVGGGGFFLAAHLTSTARNVANNHTDMTTQMIQKKVSFSLADKQLSANVLAGLPQFSDYFEQQDRASIAPINGLLHELCINLKASLCYLMDSDGTTVASSNAGRTNSLVGKNYAFRPYFKQAMTGKPAVYLALGVTTKKRGFYFSSPITGKATPVMGVIVVKYSVEKLEQELSNLAGIYTLIDPKGIVFASNRKSWLFRSLSELSSEDAQTIVKSRQFGEEKPTSVGLIETSDGLLVAPDGATYLFGHRDLSIPAGWRIS